MSIPTAWLVFLTVVLGLGAMAPLAVAQPAGTLVVGLVAEPVNLDPAQVTDLNSNRVGRRIVETLVTFDPRLRAAAAAHGLHTAPT